MRRIKVGSAAVRRKVGDFRVSSSATSKRVKSWEMDPNIQETWEAEERGINKEKTDMDQ